VHCVSGGGSASGHTGSSASSDAQYHASIPNEPIAAALQTHVPVAYLHLRSRVLQTEAATGAVFGHG
jgi:hypothetical protein